MAVMKPDCYTLPSPANRGAGDARFHLAYCESHRSLVELSAGFGPFHHYSSGLTSALQPFGSYMNIHLAVTLLDHRRRGQQDLYGH